MDQFDQHVDQQDTEAGGPQLAPCACCGAMGLASAPACKLCGEPRAAPMHADTARHATGRVAPWRPPERLTHRGPTPGPTFGPPPSPPSTGRAPPTSDAAPAPLTITGPPRSRRRAAPLVLAALVATVIGTFGLAVVLLRQPSPVGTEVDAVAGTGRWVRYRDPAGAFELEFPTEPDVSAEDVTSDYRSVEITARVLRDRFTLERVDFASGATGGVAVETWLDEMPARAAQSTGSTVQSAQRTSHAGLSGIEYVLVRPDGTTRVTALLSGRRLFRFSVTAPTDPGQGFHRFVDSFVPIDPVTGEPVTDDG